MVLTGRVDARTAGTGVAARVEGCVPGSHFGFGGCVPGPPVVLGGAAGVPEGPA
jgi:hypothetical protein